MYITQELAVMIIAYVILTFVFYILNGIIRLIKNPPFRKNIDDRLIDEFEKRINSYQKAISSLKEKPGLLKNIMYPIYVVVLLTVLSIVSLGITILINLV